MDKWEFNDFRRCAECRLFVKTKIYDKRDDFDFDIVIFPFLDGDVPRSASMVFIFLNLFDLLEFLVMLMTLIPIIRF